MRNGLWGDKETMTDGLSLGQSQQPTEMDLVQKLSNVCPQELGPGHVPSGVTSCPIWNPVAAMCRISPNEDETPTGIRPTRVRVWCAGTGTVPLPMILFDQH